MSASDFRILRPVTVTGSVLTSSSVTEPATVTDADPAVWNPATAYVLDDLVHYVATHAIYRRRIDGTTATAPDLDPTNWAYVSPTNRWKMYDASYGSQTTKADSIVWELTATEPITGAAVLNASTASLRLEITDPVEGLVFDETKDASDPLGIVDWYSYFFEPIERRQDFTFVDLPPYAGATLKFTATDTGNTVAVGVCVIGQLRTVAGVRWGASVGIKDYSVKEADEFGGFTVTERPASDRGRYPLQVDNYMVDPLKRLLKTLRATPVVYIAGTLYDSTTIYGFYRDFDIVIPNPVLSECSIELESVT
ncbi:MAG: hypothetical protein AB7P37_03235 [Ramlibacter sp.]